MNLEQTRKKTTSQNNRGWKYYTQHVDYDVVLSDKILVKKTVWGLKTIIVPTSRGWGKMACSIDVQYYTKLTLLPRKLINSVYNNNNYAYLVPRYLLLQV